LTLTSDLRSRPKYTSATREPRAIDETPEDKRAVGRGVTCQITRLPGPHERGIAPRPSGRQKLSSAQASGWRASEEGDGLLTVVTPLRPPGFRSPPPDSGVVPFSGKPSPPIKSGFELPWPRRIIVRSWRPCSIKLPRFNLGERTMIVATVPTGLAVSREPTRIGARGGRHRGQGSRGRLGVQTPPTSCLADDVCPGGPLVRRRHQQANLLALTKTTG